MDNGCCILEIVKTKLEGPLLIFTDTTISEDLELWNQLCRLQLPSKMIVIIWRFFFEFSSCDGRIEKASEDLVLSVKDTERIFFFFFFFLSREIWFGLICTLELISFSLTWFKHGWRAGQREGVLGILKHFSLSFFSILWYIWTCWNKENCEERAFLCH